MTGPDDDSRVRALRLRSQGLDGTGGATPDAVVGRLLAVQAQDERGFRLAIRSRSSGLTAHDVDDALAARCLLVTWLNRGTLYLVRSDDYWWLHPLTAPRVVTGVEESARVALSDDAADVLRFLGRAAAPARTTGP